MNITAKVSKQTPMQKKQMHATLTAIEKIVDGKLANQKVFIPILLTAITSVIAYVLADTWVDSAETAKMYFAILAYALICFLVLLISLLGKVDNKAIVMKKNIRFQPHKLRSYCFLSDADFEKCLSQFARRKLTFEERLTARCIKRKINEYAFKNVCLNLVFAILLAGVIVLVGACVWGSYHFPDALFCMGGKL